MQHFISELRRRKVVRVGGVYAVAGWIVAQVADLAADSFGAPEWVMQMLLVAILLGFPIAILLAWALEMTPDGIKRTDGAGGRGHWSLAALIVVGLAGGYFALQGFWPRVADHPTGVDAASSSIDFQPSEQSIAVLPFADLSEGRDQEWFTDGLTEEILNSLSRLPELKVISRTSSFQFKDVNLDVRSIADTLGVAHILEGSVRRVGDDLVVTAQLIRAADGTHLWSDTYDRKAEDMFNVQRDVAEKVAAALDVLLDDEKREAMFRSGTRNVGAFEAFRQGMARLDEWHARPSVPFDSVQEPFERAMALDPGYAEPAIGHMDLLAHILLDGIESDYSQAEARAALLRDLDHAAANASSEARRLVTEINREFLSPSWHRMSGLTEDLADQPDLRTLATGQNGWLDIILNVADSDLALRVADAQLAASPLAAVAWSNRATVSASRGDIDAALDFVARGRRSAGTHRWFDGDEMYALSAAGRRDELLAVLERFSGSMGAVDAWRAAMIGDESEARRIIAQVESSASWPNNDLMFAYRELGDDEAVARLAGEIDALPAGPSILFRLVSLSSSVPFDLADTPNFAARLSEAGIDLTGIGTEAWGK
jgi:TolB-like protein